MTNDKDSAVLLPCPFCGGQCAQLVIDQGDKWAHYEPSCLEVRTSYNVSDNAPWRAEAIAAWNTRQPQTDALKVAALVEASEGLKQDLLNRAEWDDDAKAVCAGAGAWFRFTEALAALKESK